jgi:hypothetical protein
MAEDFIDMEELRATPSIGFVGEQAQFDALAEQLLDLQSPQLITKVTERAEERLHALREAMVSGVSSERNGKQSPTMRELLIDFNHLYGIWYDAKCVVESLKKRNKL